MRRLLIATRNAGKVAELRELLSGTGWQLSPLPEGAPVYEETGATFADNARGKALFYAAHTGLPALADDSGLVVDALGGEPGVHSARYLDPDMPQPERNRALLERLRHVPGPDRTARFVCHLALALPDGRLVHETTGVCEGLIATEPRGQGGFGYDPIFFSPEAGRTFAQLSRAHKSALSHRGRAVRAMARFLRGWDPGEEA